MQDNNFLKLKVKKIKKSGILDQDGNRNLKPYPLFCQLSELYTSRDDSLIWKESARWIKFVEVVEESGRWSRPHVASLSNLSIIELKTVLSNGLVYLNLRSKSFKYFVDELVENMVKENILQDDDVIKMKEILFTPHFHQYQNDFEDQLIVGETIKIGKKKIEESTENDGN